MRVVQRVRAEIFKPIPSPQNVRTRNNRSVCVMNVLTLKPWLMKLPSFHVNDYHVTSSRPTMFRISH